MPRLPLIAAIRLSGPSFSAASILPTPPDMLCGGSGTNRSRGMDSREAAPVAGSRWSTIVTSLRAPPTSWGLPKSWASWGASPVRVLFPTIRMFSGGRDLLAGSGVRRFVRWTLRTWSNRNRGYRGFLLDPGTVFTVVALVLLVAGGIQHPAGLLGSDRAAQVRTPLYIAAALVGSSYIWWSAIQGIKACRHRDGGDRAPLRRPVA